MKYIICIISFIIIFQSCSIDENMTLNSELIGKWKVIEGNQEYIINIRKDSLFEMYSYENMIEVQYKIDKIIGDKLILVEFKNEENKVNKSKNKSGFAVLKEVNKPFQGETKFNIKGNHLTLIDLKTNKGFKAINCNTGICDEQKYFFRKQGVDINLSLVESEAKQELRLTQNDIKIYIGKPKNRYAMIYGQNYRMWSSGKFIQPSELQLLIIKAKLNTKEGRVVLFIDSKTQLEFVKKIVDELTKCEINEIYFPLRKNQNNSTEFELVFRKENTSDMIFEELESNFITWIKSKYSDE